MNDESQITVPRSFIELFLALGSHRPTESRAHIASRYELCEDLAQLLTDTATTKRFELGVTETDVLERVHQGLLGPDAIVTGSEAGWVIRRLAELLDWTPLTPTDSGLAE